jgi:hypothetical protein
MSVSDSEARELVRERNTAQGKLDRIKDEASDLATKIGTMLASLGVGGVIGVINAREGGTAEAPAEFGGRLPIDTAAAGAGIAAVFLTKKTSKYMPIVSSAMSASVGLLGYRMGYSWQTSQLTAAGTTAAPSGAFSAPSTPIGGGLLSPGASSATSSGRAGYRGGMAGRLYGPGDYESNAYVYPPGY